MVPTDSINTLTTPLIRLIQELDAISEGGLSDRGFIQAATPAMKRLLGEKDFLPKEAMKSSETGYARHCLYSDPKGRFSIAAMVWQPGQGTPIHDHDGTWGMIGMVEGRLEVVNYFSDEKIQRAGETTLRNEAPHVPQAGAEECVCGCADIHSVNNRFREMAISVHIYARDLEKCLVFEPVSGTEGQFVVREKALAYTSKPFS